jgi:fused signal recognition particle receptor
VEPVIYIIIGLVVVLVLAGYVVVTRRRPGSVAREIAEARTAGEELADRLTKTRVSLGGALRSVFSRTQLDQEFWDSLEEALIGADVGVKASTEIVQRVKDADPASAVEARDLLSLEVRHALAAEHRELVIEGEPAVVMVVGVNGTGKTTSIAKIAARLKADGIEPLLGAADTFRAAADTQLRTWAERVGVDIVAGQEGSDPAAVAFDAYRAARARGKDVVIVDTAGRLQSKKNLMGELGKIKRVVEREAGPIREVLLVLDATAGQNGMSQAQHFLETAGVTGIVLTKLDGTARGGIVVAIEAELGLPVKFIGVGEGIDDLIPFEPEAFVDALLADA